MPENRCINLFNIYLFNIEILVVEMAETMAQQTKEEGEGIKLHNTMVGTSEKLTQVKKSKTADLSAQLNCCAIYF